MSEDAMDVEPTTTVTLKIKTGAHSTSNGGGGNDNDENMSIQALYDDYKAKEDFGDDEDVTIAEFSRKRSAELRLKAKAKRARLEKGKNQWWLEEGAGKKKRKWTTLEHNGVVFPDAYEPHGIPIHYDGEPVKLNPGQEEVATHFARYIKTDHYAKEQFKKNFFEAFQEILGEDHLIQEFDKCDFTAINTYLEEQKQIRKNRTKAEKDIEKNKKAELKKKFGYAILDGKREALGNFTVEPPGLFLGRGNHPKAGKLKKRVMPEQISLNLSKGAKVPPCPVPGHSWGPIIHNPEVTWIACWKENINNDHKYVQFAAQSSIRGKSDRSKFEIVRKLKDMIGGIRADYTKELSSKATPIRQRATAMWTIDKLALRVGNEKNRNDEADTVGCCSLRVEHVENVEDSSLKFDFLGKDSMRYENTVKVPAKIYKNFELFMDGKAPTENIFDQITTTSLNKHLKSYMNGLSAKVFRTYNASYTMEKELAKWDTDDNDISTAEKKAFFNKANKTVAILCNHQRSVSKTHDATIEKIDIKIRDVDELLVVLKKRKKALANGETPEVYMVNGKAKPLGNSVEAVDRKIKQALKKKNTLKIDKLQKDDLKTVALGTSKLNYIDPRIVIAWCKRAGLEIKHVFPKTTREKFNWAVGELEADPDWKF